MRRLPSIAAVLSVVVLAPGGALGQTNGAFTGRITDNTGGVLPGVTVVAASPALIEGSRVTTSDVAGRYALVDLRPGDYTLTFTLAGFSTVVREGLDLPAGFTMTIDGELSIGRLDETVTVSGAAPVVDVRTNARAEVLDRAILDAIPTGHNLQSTAQLIVGVKLNRPEVGLTTAAQQTFMAVHGMNPSQTTVRVDGQVVNSLHLDGAGQAYHNHLASQEMVYETGGVSAETSGGGVRVNMIPREGGPGDGSGPGTIRAGRQLSAAPETFDFLRLTGERDVPVVGLCTGSFAMAEVGLLRGKRCAVHCRHREEFLSRYPEVAAVTDELFVIDGQAITCAGGTAAIDVAAEVIARHCGASRALKGLPELLVDEHRTTRHGLRFPYQNLLRCGDSRVERAVKLMLGQLSQPTSMRRLADRLATSLSQLNRAFAKHCRMPPARLWREMRLLHARRLLLNTDHTLAEIAAECGFVDAAHLSRHFRGAFGEAPRAFQRARAVDMSALSVTKQERPAARVG